MSGYRLRWRDDAAGFVQHLAGRTMRAEFATRAAADEVRRAMPNGHHVEVVDARSVHAGD